MQSQYQDEYEWHQPLHDQAPLNFSTSQAGTSYAGSLSSRNMSHTVPKDEDEHTVDSVYTYHSGPDAERFTRTEQGRTFNALSDTYYLPSDNDEWNRLDKQHVALAIALGGLFPAPEVVRAILSPQPGQTKRVLDLGCGTGVWCIEMAKLFPHAQVVGVDLAAVPIPAEGHPPNCNFEMDNINLGLNHFRGQFDVVHARLIGFGIQNQQQTMQDVELCLKPGGIVIWIEGDYESYSEWPAVYNPPYSESNPSGKYVVRMGYEIRRAAVRGGSDIRNMERAVDEGLWSHTDNIDPATCKTASLHLPIGEWLQGPNFNSTQQLKYVGALMRQDFHGASRSALPVLAKVGWPQDALDQWLVHIDEECKNGKMSFRVRLAWGRRRAEPGHPAPALPMLSSKQDTEGFGAAVPYLCYEEYSSQEEALAKAAIRDQGKDFPPLPLPSPAQKNQADNPERDGTDQAHGSSEVHETVAEGVEKGTQNVAK